jgi:hypothetical protein
MAASPQSIVDYDPLKLHRVYKGFGHVMFKACLYATNDGKIFVWLKNVSVKDAQAGLQKIIT